MPLVALLAGLFAVAVETPPSELLPAPGEEVLAAPAAEAPEAKSVPSAPEPAATAPVHEVLKPAPEPTNEATHERVGVTVGMAFGVVSFSSVSSRSAAASFRSLAAATQPSMNLGFELRLSESAALALQIAGGYDVDDSKTRGTLDVETLAASVSLGGRWIVNPADRVQVSPFAVLGFGWRKAEEWVAEPAYYYPSYSQELRHAAMEALSLGLDLGLHFELRLLANLYLRFTTRIIQGSVDIGGPDGLGDKANAAVSLHFVFAPSLGLRVSL